MKPWVIQRFQTFDSVNRTIGVAIHWKAVEQYFTVVPFGYQFSPVCNLSVLDLAPSGVKGLTIGSANQT